MPRLGEDGINQPLQNLETFPDRRYVPWTGPYNFGGMGGVRVLAMAAEGGGGRFASPRNFGERSVSCEFRVDFELSFGRACTN